MIPFWSHFHIQLAPPFALGFFFGFIGLMGLLGRSNGMNLLVVDLRLVIHSDISWTHLCNFCCFRRCFTVCVQKESLTVQRVFVRFAILTSYTTFILGPPSIPKKAIHPYGPECFRKFSDGRMLYAFSDSCHFSANSTSWQMLAWNQDAGSSAWKRKDFRGRVVIQVDAAFPPSERPPRFEDHQRFKVFSLSKNASHRSLPPKKKHRKTRGNRWFSESLFFRL